MTRGTFVAGLVMSTLLAVPAGSAEAVNDSWTTLASSPYAFNAGAGNTGTTTGGELYVIAGYPDGTPLQQYDPASDTWFVRPGPAIARRDPTLTAIGTKLYLAGGCTGSDCGNVTGSLEIYDTTSNSWSSGAPMPQARRCAAAAELDGKLYLVAGRSSDRNYPNGGLGDTEVYEPGSNSWSSAAPLPAGSQPCGANAVAYNHKLYVLGGQYYGSFQLSQALWIFDPAGNSWTAGAAAPVAIERAVLGVVDGTLHVAGGEGYSGPLSTHYVYGFAANTWSRAASLPAPRVDGAGGVIGVTLYVAAGSQSGADYVNTLFAWRAAAAPPPLSDTGRPVAHPAQTPAANAYGWNNTNVTVSWNWSDPDGPGDVAGCVTSSTSSGEGSAITLSASCTDPAGITGIGSYQVKVDKTAPTVTYVGNAGTYTVAQAVSITCSAADNLSGVLWTTCASVNGPAWSFGLGSHAYVATATDYAGNVGYGSASFTVTVSYDSLCALTGQFSNNSGVTHSLCAKLAAAKAAAARGAAKTKSNTINAFDNEVAAQSGKAITSHQAATLTSLANTL